MFVLQSPLLQDLCYRGGLLPLRVVIEWDERILMSRSWMGGGWCVGPGCAAEAGRMTRPTRLGSPHRGRPRPAPRARSRGRTPTTHGEIPGTTRRRFAACLRFSPGGSRKLCLRDSRLFVSLFRKLILHSVPTLALDKGETSNGCVET